MDANGTNILVVTSDSSLVAEIASSLKLHGLAARFVEPDALAEAAVVKAAPAAFVDLRLGAGTVERWLKSVPQVLILGERDNAAQVLEAWRLGARDFLPRDYRPQELGAAVARLNLLPVVSSPFLEYVSCGGELEIAQLAEKPLTIGRDPANDICFDSVVVSRFHARVELKAGVYSIRDESSRHGVFVDDVRVEEHALADGVVVRLGNAGAPALTFRSPPSGAAESTRGDRRQAAVPSSSQEIRDIAGLVDTFLKLNGDLVLEDVLQIVVSRSMELADAERGMILLCDSRPAAGGDTASESVPVALTPGGDEPELRLAMARDRSGEPLAPESTLLSRKIPLEVLKTGRGVILQDLLAPNEADEHPSTIQIGVRSAMCVPLRARRPGAGLKAGPGGGEVLGVLYVDSSTRARPFPERLLHALESLASEAAQAIYNSQLYEECLVKRQLDSEVRIARQIQQNILPPSSFANSWLELHGSYQASAEVGGDLLDYYPFGEERVTLVVGDVSGKGIPAAIFSSMLDGLCYGLGAQFGRLEDLSAAAADLNRYLVLKSGMQKFVSIFFGALSADGRLVYVNAGHNPPLHLRADDGRIDLLRTGGKVMGMFEDVSYPEGEARMRPGDLLLLYSDGLTDSQNRSGERFGADRLLRAAPGLRGKGAREAHDALLAQVAKFTDGTPPPDDVTLMVARMVTARPRASSSASPPPS